MSCLRWPAQSRRRNKGEASCGVSNRRDEEGGGSAIFQVNPCDRYSAVVASAVDVPAEAPGHIHPGKIGFEWSRHPWPDRRRPPGVLAGWSGQGGRRGYPARRRGAALTPRAVAARLRDLRKIGPADQPQEQRKRNDQGKFAQG